MSVKGKTYRGKLKQITENNSQGVQLEHATLSYKGPSKMALDTAPHGVFQVGAANRVAEVGSDADTIVLTGHDARVGDIIRPKITATAMAEAEIAIRAIPDANTIQLDGLLSAAFASADTFDIYRPITQKLNTDGSTVSGPVQINVTSGAVTTATTILDDQDTPANTVPMPVKLYGTSAYVVITAEELNVQMTHTGANPDSLQIGDGTTLADVRVAAAASTNVASLYVTDHLANVSLTTLLASLDGGARQTRVDIIDAGPVATEVTLAAMSLKLPASLGIKADAASLSVTQSTEDRVVQAAIRTAVESLDNAIAGTEMQVDIVSAGPIATEVTLASLNAKFGSLGQKASAGSAPVVLSTEQEVILTAIRAAVEIIDNAIAGTEMQVDIVDAGPIATEATLAAQSAKLPATLGPKVEAASLSVTIATDQGPLNTNLEVLDFLDAGVLDSGGTTITSAADLSVVASSVGDTRKILVIDDIGEFMSLRINGGAVLCYLPLGGGEVEVSIPSGTDVALRSETGSDITLGKIAINFLG